MNMTKFRYLNIKILLDPDSTVFTYFLSKNWILEQTDPVLVTLVQGSINIESMSEFNFLAVSAILMIISDFYWHWLLSRRQYCKVSERDITHPTYFQPPARTGIASSFYFCRSCFQCFQSTLAHPNQYLHLWTLRLAQWCKSCSVFGLAILEKSAGNAHLLLWTEDFGIELITRAFSSSKVLGIRNLELDSSISHRKLNFLNYNKLANSQMAHSIQTISITFYSYCLINKNETKITNNKSRQLA